MLIIIKLNYINYMIWFWIFFYGLISLAGLAYGIFFLVESGTDDLAYAIGGFVAFIIFGWVTYAVFKGRKELSKKD